MARETPRDNLYHRIVEEVAELATQEVPDERNSRGQRLDSVFFLQTEPDNSAPLWVGSGPKEPFQSALPENDSCSRRTAVSSRHGMEGAVSSCRQPVPNNEVQPTSDSPTAVHAACFTASFTALWSCRVKWWSSGS